ncbi:hypothetical protein IFO70_33590 [Phormidium tenue FACHB-886]|nr:hypothetical protein [Phormidium tenue FACHB-886]
MDSIEEWLLPQGFPESVPAPKLELGNRVCWHSVSAEDVGVVVGIEYAPAEHLSDWGWCYTIWLDVRSPSSQWTQTDIAWEEDLKLLPQADSVTTAMTTGEP